MLIKRCDCADPRRCAHVYHYEFELHGRRYRRSTKTANRQVASRIEDRRRLAVLDGRDDDTTPAPVTLAAHCTTYCTFTAQKNTTAYKDTAILARFQAVVGQGILLTAISPFHIEKWKLARAAAVAQATVNRELNVLRGCFSRAVEWGLVPTSPLNAVKAFKVDDTRIRVLTDDELSRVLHQAEPFTQAVCRVTLECLPRLSEVLGLHRSHLGPSWVEFRRKGGRVDRCPVSASLLEALSGRNGTAPYLFGEGATNTPPYEQKASQRIVRELRRLGIADASHHTMRHTGVTLMLEAGVNPRVIQKLAGWGSLRMLERYGHARDTEMRRAVTVTADYLAALPTPEVPSAVPTAR